MRFAFLGNPSKDSRAYLDTLLKQGLAGAVVQLEEMMEEPWPGSAPGATPLPYPEFALL